MACKVVLRVHGIRGRGGREKEGVGVRGGDGRKGSLLLRWASYWVIV